MPACCCYLRCFTLLVLCTLRDSLTHLTPPPCRSFPRLFRWSWGHQGYYIDTDGSLANSATISPTARPDNWALPAINSTLHSTVNNALFDPALCKYNVGEETALCSPQLTWRRMLLNE
jgi:hypothetical protein